jgi:hypothetical protein
LAARKRPDPATPWSCSPHQAPSHQGLRPRQDAAGHAGAPRDCRYWAGPPSCPGQRSGRPGGLRRPPDGSGTPRSWPGSKVLAFRRPATFDGGALRRRGVPERALRLLRVPRTQSDCLSAFAG